MSEPAHLAQLIALNRQFELLVPHNRALGIELVTLERSHAVMRLAYAPHLVGNPHTGVLHGGAVTALMDACSGTAAFAALDAVMPIATLDLRIDYLRSAKPGRDVVADAVCTKVTKHVAFVRGTAHDGDESDPIATCAATFALDTKRSGK